MIKKTLAVSVAALGLIAWADPKTAGPQVSQDDVAAEAKREMVYVLKARAKEEQRVGDIAFRIETANQDLCADRTARLGFAWLNPETIPAKQREAATEAFHLGDGLTVRYVAAGGPAAAAGLKPGDVLVSVNGEAIAPGKQASDQLDKRLTDILKTAPAAPVAIVARRAGEMQTLSVTPVMACAYPVVVEDSDEVNAHADGRILHVNRGILRLTTSDEELALVLGHELAHNGQHHLQAQMHNARIVGLGGFILDAAAAAGGVNTGGAFTKAGMRIGAEHASTEFEAEADYVGLYYMARAGFSTEGAEDFWRKMSVENPGAIFIKVDHPTNPARFLAIAAASKEIEAKRARGEPLIPNPKADPDPKAAQGG